MKGRDLLKPPTWSTAAAFPAVFPVAECMRFKRSLCWGHSCSDGWFSMKQATLLRCWCFLATVAMAASAAAQPTDQRRPADSLDGPPIVTAKAWAVGDGKTGELLWGDSPATPLQMASTTKIMTAWIVLQLAAEDPTVLDETVVISERSDKTSGTTAGVRAGERISVADLLYGLLLPSGNDAAVALAEHFGDRFDPAAEEAASAEDPLARFTAEMNRRAAELGMKETHYLDPHGNSRNRSSARDLLKLGWQAMQNDVFRRYVNTRRHECTVTTADGGERTIAWTNTNKLLEIEGFEGIKTGRTGGAGSCLVSSGRRAGDHLLVVVLGSTSKEGRFVDSRNLYRWAWGMREK
jgi:D-alanyl-D-alanine carboxypeptidase (penicillin-binding protein 5/6)